MVHWLIENFRGLAVGMPIGAMVGWFFSLLNYRISQKKYDWELYDRRKKHYDLFVDIRRTLLNSEAIDIKSLCHLQNESKKLFSKKVHKFETEFCNQAINLNSLIYTDQFGPERSELQKSLYNLDVQKAFSKYM